MAHQRVKVTGWLDSATKRFGFGLVVDGPDCGEEVFISYTAGRCLYVRRTDDGNRYRICQDGQPPRPPEKGDILIAIVRRPVPPTPGQLPWLSLWGIESAAVEALSIVPPDTVQVVVTRAVSGKQFGFGSILTGNHEGEDVFLHESDVSGKRRHFFRTDEVLEGVLERQELGFRLRQWRFTGCSVSLQAEDRPPGNGRDAACRIQPVAGS